MKFRTLSALLALCAIIPAHSSEHKVTSFRVAGPYTATNILMTDTADAWGNKMKSEDILFQTPLSLDLWKKGSVLNDSSLVVPSCQNPSVYLAGFTVQNTGFMKTKIQVTGKARTQTFVDGTEVRGEHNLLPGRHDVVIKYLAMENADTLNVSISSEQDRYLTINPEGKRYYHWKDYTDGKRMSSTQISASGRFVMQNSYTVYNTGTTEWAKDITDTRTNAHLSAEGFVQWAAQGDRYIRRNKLADGRTQYVYVDPLTGHTQEITTLRLANNESASFAANDTKLVISRSVEGPAEKEKDVHQVLEPDDRQPGFRNRTNTSIYDIATGVLTPLTSGPNSTSAMISQDGKHALVTVYRNDVTRRPFNFSTGLWVDLQTGNVDTLYNNDGFVGGARILPDGKTIIFRASPEAFDGVGNTLPDSLIPNMFEYELFRMDIATRKITCLTRDFNPSVSSFTYCQADGMLYALCENRDLMTMFRINPLTGASTQLNLKEPYVSSGYSIASDRAVMSYVGQSSMSTDRTWLVDLKTMKSTLLNDLNPTRLDGIQIGKCQSWNFRSERGDSIYGCYYLPPYFDESKKYPMLVYYYGGCSPVGRYLESYYNYQEWASLGYVVYVIQPSGCSGQGQEFASRHVNTYGDFTADDIIQGTKQFCKEHPFVNDKKIGCMGASYGGFMTQWLQVKTDIFAAAMSHAGISNPASYWGFGYWGYSYSATSAAHSYPWNNVDLYSGHAPLFNADKIHTPLLFMHGGSDTNVPINESIQLFTALKILGRETAFVTVDGQDHHILDYRKRDLWHYSIMAWFARWLQDDPTWWNTLYPEKNIK